MSQVTLAATQFACSLDRAVNLASAERVVRGGARSGRAGCLTARAVESPYFCIDMEPKHFALALPIRDNPAVQLCGKLARELNVVLPVSVFERAGKCILQFSRHDSSGGEMLGVYRKAQHP